MCPPSPIARSNGSNGSYRATGRAKPNLAGLVPEISTPNMSRETSLGRSSTPATTPNTSGLPIPRSRPSAQIPCLPGLTAYDNASMASAPVNGRHRPLHAADWRPAGSSLHRFERSSAENPTSVCCSWKSPGSTFRGEPSSCVRPRSTAPSRSPTTRRCDYDLLTHGRAARWIIRAPETAGARGGTSPPRVGSGEHAND